jgi:hypothetical protein
MRTALYEALHASLPSSCIACGWTVPRSGGPRPRQPKHDWPIRHGRFLRELLAVNPFAPAVQTAARGFGGVTARLSPRKRMAGMPFKAFRIRFDHR